MDVNYNESDGSLIVVLSGKCTFSDYDKFKDVVQAFEKPNITRCEINLANLEFIDSSGIGLFLMLKEKSDAKSSSLVIRSPQGQVKKIFEVTQMHDVLPIIN